MGSPRSNSWPAALAAGLICTVSILVPPSVSAQTGERLWGRVRTVSGDTLEGFIRWDRNEGAGVDLLDGTKTTKPFQFQDWWRLAHPGNQRRDRVVELAGYRITWDDDEPTFPERVESGVRLGHVERLEVTGDDDALLILRSGREVELTGGSTDLGTDLRDILVEDPGGRVNELEWEDLAWVEFLPVPPGARPQGERIHGTVSLHDGSEYTGFLGWDRAKILTTDVLEGEDEDGRDRVISFGQIEGLRPTERGSLVSLMGGEGVELSGTDDVDDGNDGILVSDPELGLVDVDWSEVDSVRFHPPDPARQVASPDGGRRLVGEVMATDSSTLRGWIRWDGDEEFSWEILDGSRGGVSFDVEFGLIASIEKYYQESTAVTLGPTGMSVLHPVEEGAKVTLRDGRELILDGSNDVTENNHGIFVLLQGGGVSPDDEEAEWIMVRWEDFLAIRLQGVGPDEEGGR